MAGEQPFYFIVSFWGTEYRNHFLRLCLSSLLSPGNIPSLCGSRSSRFLICTTTEDWSFIQSDPLFQQLAAFSIPEFIELRRPIPGFLKPAYREKLRRAGFDPDGPVESSADLPQTPEQAISPESFAELQHISREIGVELSRHHHYALRILFMSAGHKIAACQAHADKAYAVFLAPDMVLSDGAIAELDRLAHQGSKVVVAAACRFLQDECLAAFEQHGLMIPGRALILPPRLLVTIAFSRLHPETAGFEFDAPYFCDTATSAMWRVPGDNGALIHSFFWAPLLLDYAGIGVHHAEYFDSGGTTDGKYLAMHFDLERDLTVIADSDMLMLATFTRREEYYYPVRTHVLKQQSELGTAYKVHRIRTSLYGPAGDPLKRRFYAVPVRFHSGPISPSWEPVERRASAIVARAIKPPGRLLLWLIRLDNFFTGQRVRSLCWFAITYPVSKLPSHRRQQLRRLIRKVRVSA